MGEKTLAQVAWEAMDAAWSLPAEEFWQAIADAVVAAHEARRWQAIETAPKDGTPIWGWFEGMEFATAVRYQPGDDLSDYVSMWDLKPMAENPTRWTPLPAPPQEVE